MLIETQDGAYINSQLQEGYSIRPPGDKPCWALQANSSVYDCEHFRISYKLCACDSMEEAEFVLAELVELISDPEIRLITQADIWAFQDRFEVKEKLNGDQSPHAPAP